MMKIGFLGLLGLLFIALKLTNYIAWPWLWVTSPLWLPLVICVAIIGVSYSFVGIGHVIIRITDGKEGYEAWRNKEKLRKSLGALSAALRKKS